MEERLKEEEEEVGRDISIAADCMNPKKKKKKEKKEMTEAKKKYLQRRREYDQKKSALYFIKRHERRMQKRLRKQQKQDQQHSLPYPPQMEPIPSGNLPPGFDSSTSRSEFGQPINVSWPYASGWREDISAHFNIFVSDLSPEVTDATLYACFAVYPSCSDAKVMRDQMTGRSRGFGFVSIRNQQEAQGAINHLTGKWLGSRYIRCNWVAKGATSNDEKQVSDVKSVVESTYGGTSVDGQVTINEVAPENNPQYTTVYVGNLAPEISLLDLHRHFHSLGAGVIEEVRVQRDKGFGFVRYSNHSEAALAIQMGNARMFLGKPLRCSWGSNPAPPGTSSTPLPPPAAATAGPFPGITPYERQLQMSKMGGAQAAAMMHHHPHPQLALNQAMGMGAAGAASQAIYDRGYQNTQQLMYYHR